MLLLSIALIRCSKKDTKLVAEIAAHPTSGTNLEELSCTLTGRLIDGDTPIAVLIEWWWSDTLGQDEQAIAQGSYTFTEDTWEDFTTVIEAPTGYFFFQLFWVKVSWMNEDESEHEIESDKAWCDIDVDARFAYPQALNNK
jgi:hypothetical protein